MVPLLAAGSQLFGHSLFLLRAIPAFFAAASVYTTCALAVELRGGAFAEIFAGLVAALMPVLMDFGGKITTDTVGLWLWPLAALYVLRIVKGADPLVASRRGRDCRRVAAQPPTARACDAAGNGLAETPDLQ